MRKYISIKEARKQIYNRSDRWYLERIKEGKIKSANEGRGSRSEIETQSLLDYLDTLKQPAGG